MPSKVCPKDSAELILNIKLNVRLIEYAQLIKRIAVERPFELVTGNAGYAVVQEFKELCVHARPETRNALVEELRPYINL